MWLIVTIMGGCLLDTQLIKMQKHLGLFPDSILRLRSLTSMGDLVND